VLGHKRCGAVQGTVEALLAGDRPGGDIGYLIDEIAPAVEEIGLATPGVAAAIAEGRVQIVGASYDLDTGLVELQH